MESDHGGALWDMKNRKLIRHLPEFNGEISPDGKLGLHAPVRGGLFVSKVITSRINFLKWNKILVFIRKFSSYHEDSETIISAGLKATKKLQIIDMKTAGRIRTLIGNVTEGVNDVVANFTTNGQHVLYYHSGHKTLR